MNRMHKRVLLTAGCCAAMLAGGCGPGGGLLIRPVSAKQDLKETVVSKDPGWPVWDKIVIIDVDGLLMNDREEGLFGSRENPVGLFVEKLQKAQGDGRVRAVILRINSPGGGVTAADIMYQRLLQFHRQKQVPVVAVFEDVAASGAYYLACGADEIMAHPTTLTGSIGVIVQTISLAGTLQKIGAEAEAVVSGPYKDMASPLESLNEEDRRILQSIVDDYYRRFLQVVDDGRPKLDAAKVQALADGRVYTADQALANGLVDRLGTMNDAIDRAKALSGYKQVKVVIYHRPLGYRGSVYAGPPAPMQVNLLNITAPDLAYLARPQFMYLWTGRE